MFKWPFGICTEERAPPSPRTRCRRACASSQCRKEWGPIPGARPIALPGGRCAGRSREWGERLAQQLSSGTNEGPRGVAWTLERGPNSGSKKGAPCGALFAFRANAGVCSSRVGLGRTSGASAKDSASGLPLVSDGKPSGGGSEPSPQPQPELTVPPRSGWVREPPVLIGSAYTTPVEGVSASSGKPSKRSLGLRRPLRYL